MNKPSWETAPRWAKYIAQDKDGTWCFYAEKPMQLNNGWIQEWGTNSMDSGFGDVNEDWLLTLEPRP